MVNMPASAQDYLGSTLANAYQTAYNGYAARHPGTAPIEDFFGPNSPDPSGARAIRRQVAAQPAPLASSQTPPSTVGWKLPALLASLPRSARRPFRRQHPERTCMDVLYRGNLSGFARSGGQATSDPAPRTSPPRCRRSQLGFLEKLPFFNRSKGTFVNYAQWNAFSEGDPARHAARLGTGTGGTGSAGARLSQGHCRRSRGCAPSAAFRPRGESQLISASPSNPGREGVAVRQGQYRLDRFLVVT